MKIKEKLKAIFQGLKNIYKRFPISMITIIIETIVIALFTDRRWISGKIIEYIIEFGLIFIPQTLLIEAYYKKIQKKSILFYGISGVISIAIVILTNQKISDITLSWILRFIVSYCIILLTTTIWTLLKNAEKTLEEYSIRVYSNLIKTTFTYFVLSIGIGIVTALFIYLILSKNFGYDLVWRLEILLLGLYYIPNVINSFNNVEEETGKFIDGFVKYALGILLVVAFAIIYMYMIKIFVLWEIPSNQIFRILTILFILGFPIWTMIGHNNEQNIWNKICLGLPLAFIPFIFLQVYSLGIRIFENGFTPIRYIGIMFIIFEIVYILLYIFKKQKLSNIILVFNALVIISVIIPGINMFNVSDMSQYNRLKLYKQKQELTAEEKEKIYGAYTYLANSLNGKQYINKLLNEFEINEIKEFRPEYSYYENENIYIYASKDIETIDIKEYSNIYIIHFKQDKDTNIFKLLEEYISEYEKNSYNFENYFKEHNEFILEDNKKVILDFVSIRYNKNTKEIEDYDIDGYILEK